MLPVALMLAEPVSVEILHVGPQRVADAGLHRVCSLTGALGHRIAGRIDDIGVVAGASAHGVAAGAAVEDVVTRAAVQRIVAAEA